VKTPLNPDWLALLKDDFSLYRPIDVPRLFAPEDSWSGATFWRWDSVAGPMLWKIWPHDGPDERTHLKRHHALAPLTDFTPTLALPIANRSGETLRRMPDGRYAELIPWLEGVPADPNPDDDEIRSVVSLLARVHRRLRESHGSVTGFSTAVSDRLNRLIRLESADEKFLEPRFATMSPETRDAFQDIRRMAKALTADAIRRLAPHATQERSLQPVLRDVRPQHFLMIRHQVSGLIDFGAVGVDTVAVDLARLCGEWFPNDRARWTTVIKAYESAGERLSESIDLIEALVLSGAVLGGMAWFDIHFRRRLSVGREAAFQRALNAARERLAAQFVIR
jgi:homoserine kinase type II